LFECDFCKEIRQDSEIYGKDVVGEIICINCIERIPDLKKKFTIELESCVNCGDFYEKGKGVPENDFECCCSYGCWTEFNGLEKEDGVIQL
jgi:hypothetical protein